MAAPMSAESGCGAIVPGGAWSSGFGTTIGARRLLRFLVFAISGSFGFNGLVTGWAQSQKGSVNEILLERHNPAGIGGAA